MVSSLFFLLNSHYHALFRCPAVFYHNCLNMYIVLCVYLYISKFIIKYLCILRKVACYNNINDDDSYFVFISSLSASMSIFTVYILYIYDFIYLILLSLSCQFVLEIFGCIFIFVSNLLFR